MAAPTFAHKTQFLWGGGTFSTNPQSLTIPATTSGNALILISNPFASTGANANISISSAQTNNSDAFVKDAGPAIANSGGNIPFISAEIWRCQNPTAGSTSVSVLFNSPGAGCTMFGGFIVAELTGIASNPVDGTPTSSNSAATNTLSITTTSGQGDMLFFCWSGNVGTDPGAPWAETVAAGAFSLFQSVSGNATTSATVGGSPTDPFVAAMAAYAGVPANVPGFPPILGRHYDAAQTPYENFFHARL